MKLFQADSPAIGVRGIHFDLKGLPPTPKRLLELLDVLAAARTNCVLVEWEDTYPWSTYPDLRCETAYSRATVRRFLDRAEALKIKVIPLVQSFGHMENVLSKPRFARLRELADNAGDICACHPDATKVILTMADDVLATHGGRITHFHLGGDEAWTMGSCPKCREVVEKRGKAQLYLQHVVPLLEALRQRGLTPILWDDMMRDWPMASLRSLAAKANLMSWSYGAEPFRWLKRERLGRFVRAGIALWGASAFKGGDGPRADAPDVANRSANTLAWVAEARRRKMAGVVATGWSRYNSFSVACESIEASLDSLVLAGAAMWDGRLPADALDQAHALLTTGRMKELAGERFLRCREAAQALSNWKRDLGQRLEGYMVQSHLWGEPERCNPHWSKSIVTRWQEWRQRGAECATQWHRAHRGLVPERWLARHIESRLAPMGLIGDVLTTVMKARTPSARRAVSLAGRSAARRSSR